jgi:hypothetical protein
MDSKQARTYLDRWEAIEKIEKNEASVTNIDQRWRQLNALYGMGISLGLLAKISNDDETSVWQRWNLLRKMG